MFIIEYVPFKTTPHYYKEIHHAKNGEANCNVEFMHPNPLVAADALFGIGTTVIPAVL
jgi:hypothetical protein